MNKLLLIIVSSVLLFSSCISKDEYIDIDDGTMFFQAEYVNHAWGYQHKGIIIDQMGNIHEYEKPEKWVFAEENEISLEDFGNNLSKAETRLSLLPESDITRMKALAVQAKNGPVTGPDQQMYDAGTTSYSVYIYDKSSHKLRQYDLLWEGDLYKENTSEAAKEIVVWLKGLRDEQTEN
jgi:hypothetical protein